MVVVDAVDHEVHPAPEVVVGLEVEHDPVQPVLRQRPEEVAAGDPGQRDHAGATEAEHGQQADRGPEQDQRDERMDPGEEVQEVRLEHLRRGFENL